MPRARIAIPIPTSSNPEYNNRSWPTYAAAIEAAGGEPVRIDPSTTPRDLRETARSCSGILLPGSPADVLPSRYGAEPDAATNKADEYRETTDWTLLEEAERHRLPVLGICYGLQSLNVFRGGSLVQDLLPLPVNHSAGSKVAVAHTADISRESLLGSLLSEDETSPHDGFLRLPVNSSHHQAIAEPAPGMRIVARCPEDGVIEAIEAPYDPNDPWFFLAVQWHPERSTEISQASRSIFARLVREAEQKAGFQSK
ncbi:MAG TPA: gamma-glutamyl-gamma-aminobutyrate hydrolase family protein [Acidobacteriaceae bacterium]|nr:gamma-glutamyl-gamma-aminobutyrate hydrolase family protein [Acidobacteriaceae bacterium]